MIDNDLEKLALSAFDTDEEKDLVSRYQNGDVIAFKKLRRKMTPVIEKAISTAGIATPNIPPDALRTAAMKEFKRSLSTFDPSKGVQLSTWLIGNISQDLKKIDTDFKNSTRASAEVTHLMGNVETAKRQLLDEGFEAPDMEQIRSRIKDNFDKDVSVADIQDAMARQRKELSLNSSVGEDDVGGHLELGDLSNAGEEDVQELVAEKNDESRMLDLLKGLPDEDRRLYEQYRGLGQYGGAGKMKRIDIANSSGLGSEYHLEKKIQDIQKAMRSMHENNNK